VRAATVNYRKPNRQNVALFPALRNDNGCIAAHADYDRDDYVFLRQQTRRMQLMDWEERLRPVKHWGSNIVADLAWEIFA
jgi:type II secretory pathway component PulJ